MSESPKNAEIEDVLSSIRRLVAGSESASRRGGGDTSHAADGTSAPVPEQAAEASRTPAAQVPPHNAAPALVLTEAHRVDAGGQPGTEEGQAAPSAPEAPPPDLSPDAPPEEETPGATSQRPDTLFHAAPGRGMTPGGAASDPGMPVPETSSAPDAQGPDDVESGEPRRQGFGFGGARRDDPVKHIPLTPRAQAGRSDADTGAAGTGAPASPASQDLAPEPAGPGMASPSAPNPSAPDQAAPPEAEGPAAARGGRASPVSEEPRPESPEPSLGMTGPEAAPEPGDAAPQEAGDAAPTRDGDAPSAARPPHRRIGPIISEAFAHPPAERVAPAASAPGGDEAVEGDPHADGAGEAPPLAPTDQAGPEDPASHVAATGSGAAEPASSVPSPIEGDGTSPSVPPSLPAADPPDEEPEGDEDKVGAPCMTEAVPAETRATGEEAGATPPAAPPGADESRPENLFAGRLDAVDPVVLRSLVRDILREELEGEVGRQASARIRTLIREEVRHALAADPDD
jgi:hypothetical protein